MCFLLRRRHQRYGALGIARTAAQDCQADVVIVVTKTIFTTPHGEQAASAQPDIKEGRDVQVGVGDKAVSIFPVIGEVELAYDMGRIFSNDGRKTRVKDRVFDDVVAGAMVFVPTSFPVGDDRRGFVFADQIADSELDLVAEWNFRVGIGKEESLGAQQRGSLFRGLVLSIPTPGPGTIHAYQLAYQEIYKSECSATPALGSSA